MKKKPINGLKKQPCPPIVRWLGAFAGKEFSISDIARYERDSVTMKCAEVVLPHKKYKSLWYTETASHSVGVGLVVDQQRTPLFRVYNGDAYTNSRGEDTTKFAKKERLYSIDRIYGDMVYCKKYNQVLSMIEKHGKDCRVEANVGSGKKPVVYKAILVDKRKYGAMDKAKEIASIMKLPIIEFKSSGIKKVLLP